MSIRFKGKAVPFQIWVCAECPSRDRAKRPDGLPSNYYPGGKGGKRPVFDYGVNPLFRRAGVRRT